MIILGIETSCDETAAAILINDGNRITILSNVVASSVTLQTKYGGIIPEQAAREQIKSIIPVIEESLQVSGYSGQDIDAIAVTYGPGLIGSLLVGVETAKVLALIWNKPLIPINHLIGHFYANWIEKESRIKNKESSLILNSNRLILNIPAFPCIGLLVSGGHTDLVLFEDHGKYQYLGGTRDDAAGECFDKCARLLGLPYPGGPEIAKLAQKGNPKAFNLPRPMIDSKDFDFSFSGLKTAVSNLIKSEGVLPPKAASPRRSANRRRAYPSPARGGTQDACVGEQVSGVADRALHDLAASIESAIVDVLVAKTIQAAKMHNVKNIMIAGGVAANQKLCNELGKKLSIVNCQLFIPPPNLCTDNGAMIAAAGFFRKPINNPLNLQANPNLSLLT